MPIRIKKPRLKPIEKSFCITNIVCACIAMCFSVALFTCMNKIVDTQSVPLTLVVFILYILFFACCVVCIIKGAAAYRREDSMPALGKTIIYAAEIIICLMNLRFAIALLLAALGMDSAVTKITGEDHNEFIKGQYIPWLSMLVGLMLTLMISVFSTWKLLKDRKQ